MFTLPGSKYTRFTDPPFGFKHLRVLAGAYGTGSFEIEVAQYGHDQGWTILIEQGLDSSLISLLTALQFLLH